MSDEKAEPMEVEEEGYLIGFPLLDGYFREIEINILIWASIMYPETKFELVCKLWYNLMRLPDFRQGVMAVICVERPERFPGYMIIPPWLEEKGWRYLYSSKQVVDPGEEDNALMLGTTAYDDFKTMYEGFWCMGNMRSMIGDGGGEDYDLLAVPNGQGVMYHKDHEAVMTRNNREVDANIDQLHVQNDLNHRERLVQEGREVPEDDLANRLQALRGDREEDGEEDPVVRDQRFREQFAAKIQRLTEMGIVIEDPNYDDLTLRLQLLKAETIEDRLRQERRRQYPDGAPRDDEAFEARVVEVLNEYFNPQIPSLVIQGRWQQGSLVRGRVHRKGKILVRLDKYVGMGCWEGEFHYPRDSVRFVGTFRLAAPISYEYRFLNAMCNQSMETLTQPLIGHVFCDQEGSDEPKVLDTFPKPHQSEVIRRLEEAKKIQEIRDAEQSRVNSIEDVTIRKAEKEAHNKRLADTLEARRKAREVAEQEQQIRMLQAALDDVHRQLMDIEDPEERAIAFEIHRDRMRQVGVPEEMILPPDEEQNERLAAINRMRALVGALPVGQYQPRYNPYRQVRLPDPVVGTGYNIMMHARANQAVRMEIEEEEEGPPLLEDIGPMDIDDDDENLTHSSSSESGPEKQAKKKPQPSAVRKVAGSRRNDKKKKKKKKQMRRNRRK